MEKRFFCKKVMSWLLIFLLLQNLFAGFTTKEVQASESSSTYTADKGSDKDYDVYTFYFPNWGSQNGEVEGWNPKTGCEWYRFPLTAGRFEGQRLPHPLAGYKNNSAPEVMEEVIDSVTSYGIDGFIFDWYWYAEKRENKTGTNYSEDGNGMYLGGELTNGFLQAENNEDMKFAILWCNHDTDGCSAVFADADEWQIMTDYVIENYFTRENYIKINGDFYFGIYNINNFVQIFKDEDGKANIELAKTAWDTFEQKVKDRFNCGVSLWSFYQLLEVSDSVVWPDDYADTWLGQILGKKEKDEIAYLGIDGLHHFLTGAGSSTEHQLTDLHSSGKIWDYAKWAELTRDVRKNILEEVNSDYSGEVIYSPSIVAGYDSTYRIASNVTWDADGSYPHGGPLLHNVTPENLKQHATDVKNLLDEYGQTTVFINSYNEWTEGSYLAPDTTYGYGYLQAIKDVFGTKYIKMDINEYWSDSEKRAPVEEGYVFAGWYTSEENGTYEALKQKDLTADSIPKNAYAKFVSADICSVKTVVEKKAEVASTDTLPDSTTLRVLSAVDSKDYQYVGFEIYFADRTVAETTPDMTSVWSALKLGSDGTEITPEEIYGTDTADYFVALDITDVIKANFNKKIYARPYWITMDGTKVMGLAKLVRVEDKYTDNNYLSIPINLLADGNDPAEIAAGKVTITYNKDAYRVAQNADDTEYLIDIGRVLAKMSGSVGEVTVEENKVKGVVTIVVHGDTVDKKIIADGLLANIRFQKRDAADNTPLIIQKMADEFCDWTEKDVELRAW